MPSIGRRASGFAVGASDAAAACECADSARSPEDFFCDVVFMIFFLCLCVFVYRLHERAEAPALPRGRHLRRAPRAGGLMCWADAVRRWRKTPQKNGSENEATPHKKPSLNLSKRSELIHEERSEANGHERSRVPERPCPFSSDRSQRFMGIIVTIRNVGLEAKRNPLSRFWPSASLPRESVGPIHAGWKMHFLETGVHVRQPVF